MLTRVRWVSPARVTGTSLLLLSTALVAQQPVGAVSGIVRDGDGHPIANVEVVAAARTGSARTDTTGAYRLPGIRAGRATLTFRRFGFEPRTMPAVIDGGATLSLNVVLDPYVQELPGMVVLEQEERARKVLSDFYRRMDRHEGFFITRQQIEDRHPLNLSDMLRMMPGAILAPVQGGAFNRLRFARTSLPGRDCPPQYYVDGTMAMGFNIDDVEPSDVEGIEVYSGISQVPPQFNNTRIGTSQCGVVVIWTRVPGT